MIKRVFDASVALVAMSMLSPVLVLVALAIWVSVTPPSVLR